MDLLTDSLRRKYGKYSESIGFASGGNLKLESEYKMMKEVRGKCKTEGEEDNYSAHIDLESCVTFIKKRISVVVN